MKLSVFFTKNTAGGSASDTVDLKLQCFYQKFSSGATIKTQTLEEATTVNDDAQYTQYRVIFTIDWDKVDNVVVEGDVFGFILNLETDTSECDDVIINHALFSYQTKTPAMEIT